MANGFKQNVPPNLLQLYEVHDFGHASAILAKDFQAEYGELCSALAAFRIKKSMILAAGGNESGIPKAFSSLLRPLDWLESKLEAELRVGDMAVSKQTHKIDYVKGRVAADFEWNSKDQTFDRDLYAFNTFFQYNKISAAVLVTRGSDLASLFRTMGSVTDRHGVTRKVSAKFGASTTHMGKLLPRLEANRQGGCPVLVFGITSKMIMEDVVG